MSNKLRKKPRSRKHAINLGTKLKQALELHQNGSWQEASSLYRQILVAQPKNAEALSLFGALRLQQGEPEKALAHLKKAVKIAPENANFQVNLGSALLKVDKLSQAATAFRKALALNGNLLQALFNLATVLERLGQFDQSTELYKKTIARKPEMIEAHQGLARSLRQQGELDKAIKCWERLASLAPNQALPKVEIGNILMEQGNDDQAMAAYQQALDQDPRLATAHNNMGNILVSQGKLPEALKSYQLAVRHAPPLEQAAVNLAWTLKEHGKLEEAISCLQNFLAQQPDAYQTHSDLLFYMNYPDRFTPQDLQEAANGWWQRHGQGVKRQFNFQGRAENRREQPLRIGFISPDFRSHPVGTFFLPFLKALDRNRFQVHCYANQNPAEADQVTEAIKACTEHWHYIAAMGDGQVAALIHQEEIDILIDLAGHSANNRLKVLAHRPAPVQVNWLGYVNTTGLPVIDYRFTDAVTDPADQPSPCSEQIYRLPNAFFCYIPPVEAQEVEPSPCLQSKTITFGSFNNIAKLTDRVIETWSCILNRLPAARLILVGRQFRQQEIKRIFLEKFLSHQVSEQQLEFRPNQPMAQYLAMHREIDICLDPFPHNGHTITCHTLWMGVPVIVLCGNRYAARMGASVLGALDLTNLIAQDHEDYVNKAVDLAQDPDQLDLLRQGMRQRMIHSPICDTAAFGQAFGNALDEVWQSWIQKKKQNN